MSSGVLPRGDFDRKGTCVLSSGVPPRGDIDRKGGDIARKGTCVLSSEVSPQRAPRSDCGDTDRGGASDRDGCCGLTLLTGRGDAFVLLVPGVDWLARTTYHRYQSI